MRKSTVFVSSHVCFLLGQMPKIGTIQFSKKGRFPEWHSVVITSKMKSTSLFLIAFAAIAVAQTVSPIHSLSPPFNSFTWSGILLYTSSYNIGNRKLKGWLCTGDSNIKEYFIRLTNDRQGKKGYCWNDAAINSNKWVTTIKFRISGSVSVSEAV